MAFKSFIFLVLAPGVVAGYVPLILLPREPQVDTGLLAYLAIPLWLTGIFVLLWCFLDFLIKGRGTPSPIDPPKELVVTGLYKYIRNPMYVGVLMINIGHFLWFKSTWMILYVAVVFLAFHLFVTLYEEPHLKKIFGIGYEDYIKKVPRWLFRGKNK